MIGNFLARDSWQLVYHYIPDASAEREDGFRNGILQLLVRGRGVKRFRAILPQELTGIRYKAPKDSEFGTPRGWLYATDRLIGKYRDAEEDVTDDLRDRFQKMLRWLKQTHRPDEEGTYRFTDKSQVYTVKVAFLNKLLEGHDPKFVLIPRDPYASCYRAAIGKAGGIRKLEKEYSFEEKLQFASEHWANSMKYALEDGEKVESFSVFRFEDILGKPEEQLKKICQFVDLDFDQDMLPQPEHDIPFGSRFRDRWYPLRPEVNEKYYEEMTQEDVDIIKEICGEYAEEFNYPEPELSEVKT